MKTHLFSVHLSQLDWESPVVKTHSNRGIPFFTHRRQVKCVVFVK